MKLSIPIPFTFLFICLIALGSRLCQADVADYEYVIDGDVVTITSYVGAGGEVIIPSEIEGKAVSKIDTNAFYNKPAFSGALVIPSSVKEIGSTAFYGCDGFTSLVLPAGLETIRNAAFSGCSGFSGGLTLPDSLTSIENSAFRGCRGFSGDLIIPEGVEMIRNFVFRECSGLDGDVHVPSTVSDMGSYAFGSCNQLKRAIFYGNSPTTFEDTFEGVSDSFSLLYLEGANGFTQSRWDGFTKDTVACLLDPESAAFDATAGVYEIDVYSFIDWEVLCDEDWISFDLNSGVGNGTLGVTVDSSSFTSERSATLTVGGIEHAVTQSASAMDFTFEEGDSSITITGYTGTAPEVTIPSEINGKPVHVITSNSPNSFAYNQNIASIVVPEGIVELSYGVFEGCRNLSSVTLPSSLVEVGSSAFLNCEKLESITIGENVTSVGGGRIFAGCSSLSDIVVSDDNEHLASVDGVVFSKDLKTLQVYPAGKRDISYVVPSQVENLEYYSFEGCNYLVSIELPDGLKSIGSRSFEQCALLSSISIPNTVDSVGDYAFGDCEELTTVSLSSRMTEIPQGMFSWCESLKEISLHEGITWIGDYAFQNCSDLRVITMPQASLSGIGNYAFDSCGITHILLPSGLTQIGRGAFEGSSIQQIVIPDSVVLVGAWAFNYCGSLTTALLSSGMSEIPNYMFSSCFLLDQVFISEGITKIGDSAFYQCEKLLSFDLPSTLKTIGSWAFQFCEMNEIEIPDAVTSIGQGAFADCRELTSVVLPDGIEVLSSSLFSNCYQLNTIKLPDSLVTIENFALMGVSGLERIEIPSECSNMGFDVFFGADSLKQIVFLGNAPTVESNSFDGGHPSLILYYQEDVSGFSSPEWQGRPCMKTYEHNIYYDLASEGENAVFYIPPEVEHWNVVVDVDWMHPEKLNGNTGASGETVQVVLDKNESSSHRVGHFYIGSNVYTVTQFGNYNGFQIYEDEYNVAIEGYIGNETDLVIPNSVNGKDVIQINYYSRRWDVDQVESITLSDSVQILEEEGNFVSWSSLENIYVSESNGFFKSVDGVLFSKDGRRLISYPAARSGSYVVPDGVTEIDISCFYECLGLTDVTLPASLEEIGAYAFFKCSNLSSVDFPDGLKAIYSVAFYDCDAIERVILPDSLDILSDSFGDCDSLVELRLSSGLTRVSGLSFSHCINLKEVTIPSTISSINYYAFYGCLSLKKVFFEGDAPSLGDQAFGSCDEDLAFFYYPASSGFNSPLWNGFPCYVITAGIDLESSSPDSSGGSYSIQIQSSTSWEVDVDVDWIHVDQLSGIGNGVLQVSIDSNNEFSERSGRIIIGGVEHIVTQEGLPLSDLVWYEYSEYVEIGGYNGPATDIVIPLSINGKPVTVIHEGAFKDNDTLVSIDVFGIESIESNAFQNCSNLKSVKFSLRLKEIDFMAFEGCRKLEDLDLPQSLISLGWEAFAYCSSISEVTIPVQIEHLPDDLFRGCSNLKKVVFENDNFPFSSLKSLGEGVFFQCVSLSSIIFPDSLKVLGYRAFYECEALRDVVWGTSSSMTVIHSSAFESCGFESLTIPSHIQDIRDKAFRDCSSLKTAIFEGDAPTMGEEVFFNSFYAFKIQYNSSSTGFTSPTWHEYSTVVRVVKSPQVTDAAGRFLDASTVRLQWSAVAGVDLYRIFMNEGNGWVIAEDVGSGNTSIDVSVKNRSVQFLVNALNGAGTTRGIVFDCSYVPVVAGQVSDVTGRYLNANTVRLEWSDVEGEDSYRIFVNDGNGWFVAGDVVAGVTSFEVVVNSVTVQFFVNALNAAGKTKGVSGECHYLSPLPGQVSDAFGRYLNANTVRLEWSDVEAEDLYRIFVNEGDGWFVAGDVGAGVTSFEFSINSSSVQFFVNALNAAGKTKGVISECCYVSPLPGQVSDVTGRYLNANRVSLEWSDVDGENFYRVFVNEGDGWFVAGDVGAGVTSFEVSINSSPVQFFVNALNAAGKTKGVISECSYVSPLPGQVSDATGRYLNANRIRLEWSDVDGEDFYRIFMNDGSGWVVAGDVDSGDTSFEVSVSNSSVQFLVNTLNATGKTRGIVFLVEQG